jgi:hypothetical protein
MQELFLKAIITSLIAVSPLVVVELEAYADTLVRSDADYSFMLTSDWRHCQQTGGEYREVYAFETPSFYVNICKKGNLYFYSGEAKQGDINSIFIPAYSIDNGKGYQADNGNLSYYVEILPDTQTLTVERNNRQILTEVSIDENVKSCQSVDRNLEYSRVIVNAFKNSAELTQVTQLNALTNSNLLVSTLFEEKLDRVFWQPSSDFSRNWSFSRIPGQPTYLFGCS